MSRLPLPSQEFLLRHYSYDSEAGVLTRLTGPRPGVLNHTNGRQRVAGILGRQYVVARLIWRMVTGEDPGEDEVDHRDLDTMNDAWANLRRLPPVKNKFNKPTYKNSKTGHKGVRKRVSRLGDVTYFAVLAAYGERYISRGHRDVESAAAAYAALSALHHTDCGRLA